MKYKYFANVIMHVEFEVEGNSVEEADALAVDEALSVGIESFKETGYEVGRFNDTGWEMIARDGDI